MLYGGLVLLALSVGILGVRIPWMMLVSAILFCMATFFAWRQVKDDPGTWKAVGVLGIMWVCAMSAFRWTTLFWPLLILSLIIGIAYLSTELRKKKKNR